MTPLRGMSSAAFLLCAVAGAVAGGGSRPCIGNQRRRLTSVFLKGSAIALVLILRLLLHGKDVYEGHEGWQPEAGQPP